MQVSEAFHKILRATLASVAVIALAFLVLLCVEPSNHVEAQNAGVVGIQAKEFPLWQSATSTQCSKIIPDIGQGSNLVYVSQSAGGGGSAIVDVEWNPNNDLTGSYLPITAALYADVQAATHVLTFNGYFPNVRSCVTYTSGTWSAWFTEISGPASFVSPGIGTFGATSPVVCDQNSTSVTPNTSSGFIGPHPQIASTDLVVVCGISASFDGTTTTGSLNFTWSGNGSCTGPVSAYVDYTTANTPQNYSITTGMRSFVGSGSVRNYLCMANSSGAGVSLVISWASLHNF